MPVKKLLIISIILTGLASCNKSNKQIAAAIANADSVAINYFAGDGKMDSVRSVKIIRDKAKLEQLAGFISASSASDHQCGIDGSIHFFKKNMVMQDIDFRMNDANCMYFRFKTNGEYQSTTLSPEAKQFLETTSR